MTKILSYAPGAVQINGLTYGHLSYNEERDFWTFIPATTAHRSSRKLHKSAQKAVPNWVKRVARKHGYSA